MNSIADTNGGRGSPPRTPRARHKPEVTRRAAIEAAQAILVTHGPTAVTLQAVAASIGMTHGNLTHHFGTSAALHAAMMSSMAETLQREATVMVLLLRRGEIAPERLVNLVFDGLANGGYGRLIAWLSATGQQDLLAPMLASLARGVSEFRASEPPNVDPDAQGAGPVVLGLLCHAFTASLIGEGLERATSMQAGSLRRLALSQLERLRTRPG